MHVAYYSVRGLAWNIDYSQQTGVFHSPQQAYGLARPVKHCIYGVRLAL